MNCRCWVILVEIKLGTSYTASLSCDSGKIKARAIVRPMRLLYVVRTAHFPHSFFSAYLLHLVECFFFLIQYRCFQTQVFGGILVQEFNIFNTNTEWNLLSSHCEKSEKFWKRSGI